MNSLSFSKAIFLLFFMLLAKVLTAQPQLPGLSITGPAIACYGSYGVYDIEGLLPSGVTRFEWSGADFSEMPGQVIQGGILISNSPTAIVHFPLFWYISYVHLHLNIYVNNILVHSQTVDIGLNYIYVNAHLNSGTLCPGATPYQCKQEACVGTTITYSTQLAAAAADISWDVEGATSYIVNPDNSITVLWEK